MKQVVILCQINVFLAVLPFLDNFFLSYICDHIPYLGWRTMLQDSYYLTAFVFELCSSPGCSGDLLDSSLGNFRICDCHLPLASCSQLGWFAVVSFCGCCGVHWDKYLLFPARPCEESKCRLLSAWQGDKVMGLNVLPFSLPLREEISTASARRGSHDYPQPLARS